MVLFGPFYDSMGQIQVNITSSLSASRFNTLFDASGGAKVLFNARTLQYQTVSNDMAKRLAKGKLDHLGIFDLSRLKAAGLLVSSDTNEIDILHDEYMRRKHSVDRLMITIIPSYRCNFRCPKCYQNSFRNLASFTDEIVDAVKQFISYSIDLRHPRKLILTLYGGEPTLVPETCLDLISCVDQICHLARIKLDTMLLTNGSTLNEPSCADLMGRVGVIQISIMEGETAQLRYRPYTNGSNSYRQVMKGVQAAAEAGKRIRIRFTISTVKHLKKNIARTFKHIFQALGSTVYPNIEFFFTPLARHRCTTIESKKGLRLRQDRIDSMIRSIMPDLPWNESHFKLKRYDQMFSLSGGGCSIEICSYVKGDAFVINPMGDMYFCATQENVPDYLIGNICAYENVFKNATYLVPVMESAFSSEKCRDCPYLPLCLGECTLCLLDRSEPDLSSGGCKGSVTRKVKDFIRFQGVELL